MHVHVWWCIWVNSLVSRPEREKIKVVWYLLYACVCVSVPGKPSWGSAPYHCNYYIMVFGLLTGSDVGQTSLHVQGKKKKLITHIILQWNPHIKKYILGDHSFHFVTPCMTDSECTLL